MMDELDDVPRAVGRDQNEEDVSTPLPTANLSTEFRAIHLRHLPIGDDHRVLARTNKVKRLASVRCHRHFVAEVNQRVREELSGNNVVVDY